MDSAIAQIALVVVLVATLIVGIIGVATESLKRQKARRLIVSEEDQLPAIEAIQYVAQQPHPTVAGATAPTAAEDALHTAVEETQATVTTKAQRLFPAEKPAAIDNTHSILALGAQPVEEETLAEIWQNTEETVSSGTELAITEPIENSPTAQTRIMAIGTAELTDHEQTQANDTGRAQSLEAAELVVPEEETKKRSREPIKRGGKPRGPTQVHQKARTQETKLICPNLEIVCWKRERQWVVAVEVPDDLREKPDLTVLQNGLALPKDELEEGYWRLEQLSGEVLARWNFDDADQEAKTKLGQDGYLLFKLIGRYLEQGRLVKSPTSGSYLVIGPETWERDEVLSGPPPVMPEPVSIEACTAHFFELQRDGIAKIAFRQPDKRHLVLEKIHSRFELVGNRIEDSSDSLGPLFGEKPPRIQAHDAQAWANVSTVIIGEEGRGRGRWRTAFRPARDQAMQDLPRELADRNGGWYHLRFYNKDNVLIESMDFRFLSALKAIRIPQPPPLPDADGHKPIRVEFLHDPSCTVQPASSTANVKIGDEMGTTTVIVGPNPASDESRWLVCAAGGPAVEVTVNVERVWWTVAEEKNLPQIWQDRPVVLSRRDFEASSHKGLWVRLPKCRWVEYVLAGFDQSKARRYKVSVTDKAVVIPLREFSDCAEVADQSKACSIMLWVKPGDQYGVVLAVLPASQVTKPPADDPAVVRRSQSWVGLGIKRTAIATAVIQNGAPDIKVNGRPVDDYFMHAPQKARLFLERLLDLKDVRDLLSRLEVNITVEGSSPIKMRQAKAVAHAIARALMRYDRFLTARLKQAGYGGIDAKHMEASSRGEQ